MQHVDFGGRYACQCFWRCFHQMCSTLMPDCCSQELKIFLLFSQCKCLSKLSTMQKYRWINGVLFFFFCAERRTLGMLWMGKLEGRLQRHRRLNSAVLALVPAPGALQTFPAGSLSSFPSCTPAVGCDGGDAALDHLFLLLQATSLGTCFTFIQPPGSSSYPPHSCSLTNIIY